MASDSEPNLQRALAAIFHRDGMVRAFAHVDERAAFSGALDTPYAARSALSGCTAGIKDIIDVAGMPTRAGSATRADARPACKDAEVVLRLRRAGAIILGKTHTTEFAYRDPAPTRNPWNVDHTPGGSSSGSAAAVAAGMVDFALGTQTAGSVCRPAAYCGVAAIKPTYGTVPTTGVCPLAPSFDTIGCLANSVTRVAAVFLAMTGNAAAWEPQDNRPVTLGVLPRRFNAKSTPIIEDFHARTVDRLRASGFGIKEVELPVDPEAIIVDHRIVMQIEAWQHYQTLYESSEAVLGPHIRELIERGSRTSSSDNKTALLNIRQAARKMWAAMQDVDALLLQPVPDVAPRGLEDTGSPLYITPWTALRGPIVVVPSELEPVTGLPITAMIAAAPGRDIGALRIGERIQMLIDQMPD